MEGVRGRTAVERTEDRMCSSPFMVVRINSSPDDLRSIGGILGDGGYGLLSGVIRPTCLLLSGGPLVFFMANESEV